MLSDSSLAAGLLCAVLPLVLCALLNGAQAACVYLDDATLRHQMANGEGRAARIVSFLSRRGRGELLVDLAAALCLLVSAAALRFGLAPRWFSGGVVPVWATLLLLLVLSLLFVGLGRSGPRRLAGYIPEAMTGGLFDVLWLCALLLTPLAWLLELLSGLLVRLAGRDPSAAPRSVTEEEIRMLVDEGEERGAIEEQEKDMINSIFEFDDRDVSEVMTHRTEVAALPIEATLKEVADTALHSGYSRMPVYDGDIDNICGIVYAKDLLRFLGDAPSFSLQSVMRQALYVPESSSCADVFSMFQREKTQMAVVVDEYGGTYGIVTMEDLLESIVGNIQDEYDNERSLVTEESDGVYLLDGALNTVEFERLLDLRLPDDSSADSLSGFVIELLDGAPSDDRAGRSVRFQNVTLTVLEASDRRIDKLRAVVEDDEDAGFS